MPRPLLMMSYVVGLRLPEDVCLAEFEGVGVVVEHGGSGSHDADVDQSLASGHDPLHDREHLLRTRHVDDPELADGIEGCDVVVPHVGGAVGAGLEV